MDGSTKYGKECLRITRPVHGLGWVVWTYWVGSGWWVQAIANCKLVHVTRSLGIQFKKNKILS